MYILVIGMKNSKSQIARLFQLVSDPPVSEETRNLSNQLLYVSFFTILLALQKIDFQSIKAEVQSVEVLGFVFGRESYNLVLAVALVCCVFYSFLLWSGSKSDASKAIQMIRLQAQLEELPEGLREADVFGSELLQKAMRYQNMSIAFERQILDLKQRVADSEGGIDFEIRDRIKSRIAEVEMENFELIDKATAVMNSFNAVTESNQEAIIPIQKSRVFHRWLTIMFPLGMAGSAVVLAVIAYLTPYFK